MNRWIANFFILLPTLFVGSGCRLNEVNPLQPFAALMTTLNNAVPHKVGGTVTGLAGTLVLQLNGGNDLTLTGDGPYSFAATLLRGNAYNVSILTDPPLQDCTVTSGSGVIAGDDIADANVTCVPDTTPPTILSSSPAGGATGVSPDPSRITVTFSEPMDTMATPTLTVGIWDGTSYVGAPFTAPALSWSSSTNLSIDLSWLRFPEKSTIQWSLTAAGLQDAAGNSIASGVTRIFSTTVLDQTFVWPDTGQTGCYYYNGVAWTSDPTCLQTYTVGDLNYPLGQDRDYSINPQSYSGPINAPYVSDYTTTDNVTGLIWKSCSEGQTGGTCAGGATTFTWVNALDACAVLNSANAGAGYSGITTWRLPTVQELATIENFGTSSPSINTTAFPATVAGAYWTSTASPTVANARFAQFTTDFISDNPRSSAYYVRCVSSPGGVLPHSFTDNGDGTVADNGTGLTWQQCASGQSGADCSGGSAALLDWPNAVAYCETLSLSGMGWRLPSHNELLSIWDLRPSASPYINGATFPNTPSSQFWSSTSSVTTVANAHFFSFNFGYNGTSDRSLTHYVRCVR